MSDETRSYSIATLAVSEHMLDRMLNVFGDPEVPDLHAMIDEYSQQLKHFSPDELREGCKILFSTFRYKRWPRPSECIDACTKARERIAVAKAKAERDATAQARGGPAPKGFVILQPHDMQFGSWIVHMREAGRDDLAVRAERCGEIAVATRWPSAMQDFLGVGPFEMKDDRDDPIVQVVDGDGRRIR